MKRGRRRLSSTDGYTYVSGKNRINTVSGPTARTYTYDAAGNIATNGASSTIGRTAYTYNARGRLVITATRTSSTATASVTHYYNALGQRARKTGADGTVNFIYDEAGHLVGEFNGSNALIQETAWLDDTPIAMLSGTSTIQYIHADHLNTPRVITNTAGTMLWWWNADAFGDYTANEDVDGNGQLVKYNPRFPGQYYDVTAKSNYNYFRDYDPMTGRYLQSDPIGLAGGLNTYAYVDNNPLAFIDPSGLSRIGDLKRALEEIYKKVGGKLPKCPPGKYGSPQRGDPKKGYRYDKEGHPNAKDPTEQGPHINCWDYTGGKRRSSDPNNPRKGAVPVGPGKSQGGFIDPELFFPWWLYTTPLGDDDWDPHPNDCDECEG